MSALGNYIHLHKENYLTHGVAEIDEAPKPYTAINSLLASRLSSVKPVSEATLTELRQRLKYNTKTQENADKTVNRQKWQEKIDAMYKLIASYSTTRAFGRGVGRVSDQGQLAGPSNYKSAASAANSPSAIEKGKQARRQILQTIDTINSRGQATEKELKQLTKLYKTASLGQSFSAPGSKSILGGLQQAADDLAYNTYHTHVIGAVGEHLVAMCDDTAQSCAVSEVQKAIKSAVVGGKKSAIVINKDMIAKDLSQYITMDKNNNNYILSRTQNKVDVNIKINHQDVYANVKTYGKPKEGKVTLQSNISLLSTLTFLEQFNQFGTHWLNMHAAPLKGEIGSADQTLKEEVAYEALVSGNPFKAGGMNANVFVFIDYLTGQIFVKDVATLLTKELHRFKIYPNISSISFTNHSVVSRTTMEKGKEKNYTVAYGDRITAILMQARATQLRVAFNISAKGK